MLLSRQYSMPLHWTAPSCLEPGQALHERALGQGQKLGCHEHDMGVPEPAKVMMLSD